MSMLSQQKMQNKIIAQDFLSQTVSLAKSFHVDSQAR